MAAAPAESSTEAMEALFRPTTRYRDLQLDPDEREDLRGNWTELELLPGLTVESVRATGVTCEDFCLFLQRKLVWMTPDVYVCPRHLSGRDDRCVLWLRGDDGTPTLDVHVRSGTASAAATAICNFSLRLFATSEQHEVVIGGSYNSTARPPISGAGLSLFFQESRSCLRKVTLNSMALNEDQCRALATMSRLDVELEMSFCILADDAAGAFVKCLHSDGGPVKLLDCGIDSQILASALAGDSRVTRFELRYRATSDADMAVLFTALASNRGLLNLNLRDRPISSENWRILCESLKAHPTLVSLDLRTTSPRNRTSRIERTRVLAKMVQRNTVLHTITLSERERDQQIYTAEILPHLETNLYRPRVLAVKKTKERPFRESVLGRALDSVKSSPNLLWMFLSGNVDAFVRSEGVEESHSIEVPVAVAAVVESSVAGSKR